MRPDPFSPEAADEAADQFVRSAERATGERREPVTGYVTAGVKYELEQSAKANGISVSQLVGSSATALVTKGMKQPALRSRVETAPSVFDIDEFRGSCCARVRLRPPEHDAVDAAQADCMG